MFKSDKILIVILFLAAFIFTLFFTLGVPFFWEDGQIFQYTPPSLKEFLMLSKPDFFSLNYNSRTMTGPLLGWQHYLLGENVLNYRITRAVLYALLVLACFLLLKRFTSKVVAFWGAFFYIFVPETWFQVIYQDIGIFSHLSLVLAFLIFLSMYKIPNHWIVRFIKLAIVLVLLNFSIGAKHEGRYALFVILPLCLICERKIIWRNIWFFIVLLFISVPVMGLFNKHAQPLVTNDKINLSLFNLLTKFFINFKDPFFTLGIFMWGSLIFSLFLLIIAGYRKKDLLFWLKGKQAEGLIFSFFWFMSALIFNFFIECWNYSPRSFQKGYYMYLWMPFLVFVFTVINSAYRYTIRKKMILVFFIILSLISFVFNVVNLNKNRGAWGGYWVGLGNLSKFININSSHALLLLPPMHFHKGAFFYGSFNQVDLTPAYTDIANLRNLYNSGKYDAIYIADRNSLDFKNTDPVIAAGIAVNISDGPYDKFKSILGKKPQPVFFIYRYDPL